MNDHSQDDNPRIIQRRIHLFPPMSRARSKRLSVFFGGGLPDLNRLLRARLMSDEKTGQGLGVHLSREDLEV